MDQRIPENNKLVSFLVPTRGKSEQLINNINSIAVTCDNLNRIEVLFLVDDDDLETINILSKSEFDFSMKVIVSKRHGYDHIERYHNEASLIAKGKWLWIWNDDAKLTNKGWDSVLEEYNDRFVVINPYTINPPWDEYTKDVCIFPILPRKWIDVFGRVSPWNHVDTYIFRLTKRFYMMINESRIQNIHEKDAKDESVVYHRIPFPFEEFESDLQKLRNEFGLVSRVKYFISGFPNREYRKIIRKINKIKFLSRR